MRLMDLYKKKLIRPEKAAALIDSGTFIELGHWALFPAAFDKALSARAGRVENVKIRTTALQVIPEVYLADPEQKSFSIYDWYFTKASRKMSRTAPHIGHHPFNYHEMAYFGSREDFRPIWPDVFVAQVCPMDKYGFFNWGISNDISLQYALNAKICILEVNEKLPRCLGGFAEGIHLRDVSYVIENPQPELLTIPAVGEASPEESRIAELIVPEIRNGTNLQLGVGALPNAVGKLLAQSDLKDLGVQSEMFCDAFMDLHEAGKISNKNKSFERFKSAYTFALGTAKLYDFMHDNPTIASFPVDYLNNPSHIQANPHMVSINNLLEVDLFTQVCSESSGPRQISGTGGQLEFANATFESVGGKSFLAFTSTYTDKNGKKHSRILPTLTKGGIVTTPRSIVQWLVTEYGKINVKGLSIWERAEALIGIAHPDFRDDLIREAEAMRIWRPSNKRA